MDQLRRTFLKNAGIAGAAIAAIGTGLLRPVEVLAATWNKLAFTSTNVADAMRNSNYNGATESKDILVKTPDIAENGASVPVEVISNIPATTSIAIFVEKNQTPLIADFDLSNGAEPYISTRIKMSQTSLVRIAVRAGGKVYTQAKEVKVTIGGCGG
ncbi:MAG: thiosulfate oxidation carrier protein SoxY [Hydrogenophilales bacterium]|nr:thiosulfate oxidation carrier protein SoxY [Hydrogenophilales bacterium]